MGKQPTAEVIAANIKEYASKNGLSIHPGQTPDAWAKLVIKNGGCPCVPGRRHCPCEYVLEDIKELGRCRCGLFCNATYLEEYWRLKSQLKGNRRGRKR